MLNNGGKILEGVFAINKPTGISSAEVLRELQRHFDPSDLFAPWLARETYNREQESRSQRRRRRNNSIHVKVGHGGTLDPLATGVLITGVGRGTKVLQSFLECTKEYEAIVVFGASTDTYDRTGKILKRAPYSHVTKELVEKALNQFRGKILQLPPLYSALKMDGKPLYEYAREGKPIPREIEKRPVEVEQLELVEWMEGGTHKHRLPSEEAGSLEKNVAERVWEVEDPRGATGSQSSGNVTAAKKRKLEEQEDDLVTEHPASKKSLTEPDATMSGGLLLTTADEAHVGSGAVEDDFENGVAPPAAKLRMTVTSGFYVRSLCHDLGTAVGSQAIMAELIRTRQGQFQLGSNVLEYDELARGEKVWAPQIQSMLEDWSKND